jgi:hypothetical protein
VVTSPGTKSKSTAAAESVDELAQLAQLTTDTAVVETAVDNASDNASYLYQYFTLHLLRLVHRQRTLFFGNSQLAQVCDPRLCSRKPFCHQTSLPPAKGEQVIQENSTPTLEGKREQLASCHNTPSSTALEGQIVKSKFSYLVFTPLLLFTYMHILPHRRIHKKRKHMFGGIVTEDLEWNL